MSTSETHWICKNPQMGGRHAGVAIRVPVACPYCGAPCEVRTHCGCGVPIGDCAPERLTCASRGADFMSTDDAPVVMAYEGLWTRFSCGSCGEMCDVEDDLQNGAKVECDACGTEGELERGT
jgi:hypothetical protein